MKLESYPQSINNLWITLCERIVIFLFVDEICEYSYIIFNIFNFLEIFDNFKLKFKV